MKLIPRSEWTATIPRPNMGAEDLEGTPYFRPSEVSGITFYHPGQQLFFVEISPYSYLESTRKHDFAYNGYSDISYNFAVAPNVEGVFCLRGLCNKSAAHKNRSTNSTNVSVLTLLGTEEPPTDLLLSNLAACRDFVLSKFPNATNFLTTLPFDLSSLETKKVSSQFTCSLPSSFSTEANVQTFELIEHLAYWGYYRARNDGVYGPVCTNAVMELQADLSPNFYRKRVDGLYGRYTREAFCQYMRQ